MHRTMSWSGNGKYRGNYQRRRRWTRAEKSRAVEELNVPGMTVSYVARKYAISPTLLFRWRKLMSEGGKQEVKANDDVVAAAEVRELKKRIRELERGAGQEDSGERDSQGSCLCRARKKTDLAVAVLARRGFPVKDVAETLKVSRSNLVPGWCDNC